MVTRRDIGQVWIWNHKNENYGKANKIHTPYLPNFLNVEEGSREKIKFITCRVGYCIHCGKSGIAGIQCEDTLNLPPEKWTHFRQYIIQDSDREEQYMDSIFLSKACSSVITNTNLYKLNKYFLNRFTHHSQEIFENKNN